MSVLAGRRSGPGVRSLMRSSTYCALAARGGCCRAPRSDGSRAFEADFWLDFDALAPAVIAALLTAMAGALARLPTTVMATKPRMADFARWVELAAPDLGVLPGEFLAAYEQNRHRAAPAAASWAVSWGLAGPGNATPEPPERHCGSLSATGSELAQGTTRSNRSPQEADPRAAEGWHRDHHRKGQAGAYDHAAVCTLIGVVISVYGRRGWPTEVITLGPVGAVKEQD